MISVKKWNSFDRDDLFFLAYLLLFLNTMLATYINFDANAAVTADYIARFLFVLFLGVCIASLIMRRDYTVMEILSIGGILILGGLSYFLAGTHVFLDFTLIMAISKGIDFKKFIKRLIVFLVVFILVMICLTGLGILSSAIREKTYISQTRYSMGFNHPNVLGVLIFELIAAVVVLERKNLKAVHLWLLLGLGLVFYWITGSQSSLVAVCLLIAAALLYKLLARKALTPRQMKIVITVVLIVAVITVFLLIYYYWGRSEEMAYQNLAGRIRQAQRYFNAYGVNLFGTDFLTGNYVALPGYAPAYSYLDNGEAWYLLRLGIVGFTVFFYTYIRMLIKTINRREFVLCIVATVFLVYSLTESTSLRVPFDFMIIYAGTMLYSGNTYRKMRSKGMLGGTKHVSTDQLGLNHEQIN